MYAHFLPLTEGTLFQQQQQLEGENGCGACDRGPCSSSHLITPNFNNYWRRTWSCDQLRGVYYYKLNSIKPIYQYDAGIQDNKEGG